MAQTCSSSVPLSPGDRVCLTGGGGYLGRHVACALLEQGFQLLITLRNLEKAEALRRDLAAHLGRVDLPVDFVRADLTSDQCWDLATGHCEAVVHTASPFPDRTPKDPRGLIRLAVDGTERVLRAAHAQGVSRIVLTSSIVAVTNTELPEGRNIYDERDWSESDDPRTDHYAMSKLTAERRAWELVPELGLALTVLNPGLIFGPPVGDSGATSVGIVKRFLRGRDPALPDAGFPSVDVRDVAAAHALALLRPASVGQRLVLAETTLSMADIAATIGKLYPSRAIRTGIATHGMVRLAARFDPTLDMVLPHLGEAPKASGLRACEVLGISFQSARAAVAETARGLMRQELAEAQAAI
jgi:dihydroflavonol-4-reductase